MKNDILTFFSAQRQIFGICPHSGKFFRLSDCKIYIKIRPKVDWMDKLISESEKLDRLEEKIEEVEEKLRELARQKGRLLANKVVKKIDPIFTPRKLNPDDAKVILHPVDFLVFNGMKSKDCLKDLIFLDRKTKTKEHRKIQKSLERTVTKGNYEWITLRVSEEGVVTEE